MELGIIRQVNIDVEMQASYLDYAMSVIVARALPDVRDGLKPVHRRILYAMHDLGLTHDKPYKKSARIVGEVLGKYHPHGDAAVYEAMVRMAQDFSLRYPLVDGQGNFGSVDGDNAAAMRYTEARLAKIAGEMLGDIEKDTVDWADNFDGTLKEPSVLPAALPNLLVNGASGIAVGMATNIPPHNLNEVCDALGYLIDNFDRHDDVTMEDLMRFIPGPDFPTGGVVYRYAKDAGNVASDAEREDVIAMAYASGKGSIVMQAKAHIEEMSRSKNRIVVTELPYQANKSSLIERIAELVRDGRLEGITDLRDESDRTGMRICIELTRTVDPRQVLADLFKLTPLQQTFGVSLLALVADEHGHLEPRLLSLKRLLLHYIEHRQEVILRRTRYELARARQRAHILEGLLRALDVLDEIIALIRKSRSADDAKVGLIKQFQFTEIQAQAILDMQLRRLAALERKKLQDEYKELLVLIKELEALLKSPQKVLALIKQNLLDLKARYGDGRRTQIADRGQGTLTTHDLLPDEEVWVALAADGVLTRQSRGAGDAHRAGGRGAGETRSSVLMTAANTRDDLYLFSVKGQATRISVHQIPEGGAHFADLSGFTRRDRVAAAAALPKPGAEPLAGYLLLGTTQGKVKRVALADLLDQAAQNPPVIGLDEKDELLWAGVSVGGGDILLVTAQGQAIRFTEEDVRPMGLPAGGIGGIKLAAKDRVVVGVCLVSANQPTSKPTSQPPTHLALVTTACYAKRVPVAELPTQGRNGQGVIALKITSRLGDLAGAALCGARDRLVFTLGGGKARSLAAADVPEQGRPAQGKFLAELALGTPVEALYAIAGGSEEPVVAFKPVDKPVAKTADKPSAAAKKPAESMPKPAAGQTADKPAAAAKKSAAPPEKPTAKPAAKPADKPAAKTADKPTAAAKKPAAPAEKPTAGQTVDKPTAAARKSAASAEKPTARAADKPTAAAKPADKPAAKTAGKPTAAAKKPAAPAEKPTAGQTVDKPTAAAKKSAASAEKPTARAADKPTAAAKTTPQPAVKPADRPTAKAADKSKTAKPADRPISKPTDKPTTHPTSKPAEQLSLLGSEPEAAGRGKKPH